MILNNAPQNAAVLSNVGEIGEFRIRNSAKAFRILSDGLYANKIRAIIRELSCNAYDSHVAAGRSDVPFEVHLPTQLEPWFSVTDFGIGLNHDQVINIYTTYFESTKTNSNEFVGALGLGSKSPFSYTENFTVTACQAGVKRIYTAFINDAGVPSVALMSESATQDPNGVEVKFAVTNYGDFHKFSSEAEYVLKYFILPPRITGSNLVVQPRVFIDRNIVPGIHQVSNGHKARAIMGNICYPIDVPNAKENLGDLASLLACPIEIEFAIGELDFQASREGLSYIPSTIEAIRKRLEILKEGLTVVIADTADKISCEWARAEYLQKKYGEELFRASVIQYVQDRKFDLFRADSYSSLKKFEFPVDDVTSKYNIKVTQFHPDGYSHKKSFRQVRAYNYYSSVSKTYVMSYTIELNTRSIFVINDTKSGIQARTKYHYSQLPGADLTKIYAIVVLEAVNPELPADYEGFIKSLRNPPTVIKASTLEKKPTKPRLSVQGIMVLTDNEYYDRRRRGPVWRQVNPEDVVDSATYYYVPMSGSEIKTRVFIDDLYRILKSCYVKGLENIKIHGVRKSKIEDIKKLSNWIDLESHIVKIIRGLTEAELDAVSMFGNDRNYQNIKTLAPMARKVSDASKFSLLKNMFTVNVTNIGNLNTLIKQYADTSVVNGMSSRLQAVDAKVKEVLNYYPMLKYVSNASEKEVLEYVQMVDNSKSN